MKNENKKIGVLTSTPSFDNNYGAILQAYALQKQLKLLGYAPYVVRYNGYNEMVASNKVLTKKINNIISLFFKKRLSVRHKIRLIRTKKLRDHNKAIFREFANLYISFSDEEYSYTKLKQDPPEALAFICGSDQVWNPRVHGGINDPGYFLDFVPNGIKRIAYAPSIGVNVIPDNAKKDLKQLINKMDAVSVREESGAKIIREVCDLDVSIVLDPTLLLPPQHWGEIEMPLNLPEKYIACYRFGKLSTTERQIVEISKKMNLPIVNIPSTSDTLFKTNYDIGPREFIHVIKNATLVCTDSFHATAFSIINHTPFYSFLREHPENGVTMNSRITNLLQMTQFENRLIMPQDPIPKKINLDLNFERSDILLQELREKSLQYLINALDK